MGACSQRTERTQVMKHITEQTELQLNHTAVALGKFDGFHRGHQLLLGQVRKWQEEGLTGVIVTFVPAGQELGASKHIDGFREKKHKAEASGVDILLEYPFTREFAAMEPEVFVTEVLVKQLGVQAVAVGRDFRFGRNRSGDVSLLQKLGKQYDFQVRVFDKLTEGKKEISSSLIRTEIEAGHMEEVSAYMGQGYLVFGEVVHGKELGTAIGIPTANQWMEPERILPPFGVYASRLRWNGQVFHGISNLGCKPTVSKEQTVGLETFIFDFNEKIYGEWIEVELLHFVRPERKFQGIEELKKQMQQDIAAVKRSVSL